jgi:hypothetical protein
MIVLSAEDVVAAGWNLARSTRPSLPTTVSS